MASVRDRLAHAGNAFSDRDDEKGPPAAFMGSSYGFRPDRTRSYITNERSLVTAIYNRIAIDAASIPIRHVKLDKEDRFDDFIKSGLDYCLRIKANIDQAGSQFRQDIVQTLCNEGTIAVVAVDTTLNPKKSAGFEVKTLRVGTIVEWKPEHVLINLYNQDHGQRENIWLEKKFVAVVENPLYAIMNDPTPLYNV